MHRRPIWPSFVFVLAVALGARAQTTEVFLDSDTPGSGGTTVAPFSQITLATMPGYTMVQRLPALDLAAAGLTAGAQLTDVALAAPANATILSSSFVCAIGPAASPWDPSQLLGNVVAPVTVYDTAIHGAFSYPVVANQWSPLPLPTPLGVSWDGVSDLALYISIGLLSIQQGGTLSPTGPIFIWGGNMRTAGGTIQRNTAPGFGVTTATANDMNGLKVRLTFFDPPPPPGTTTVLTSAIAPGQGSAVLIDAPAFAGQFYAPIVSCTNVPGSLPGVFFPLPVTPDGCTTFQYTHPLGSLMFTWGFPGSQFGVLDSIGQSVGIVTSIAGLVPPGLNLDLHITYLTLDGFGVTGVHGVDTLTLL